MFLTDIENLNIFNSEKTINTFKNLRKKQLLYIELEFKKKIAIVINTFSGILRIILAVKHLVFIVSTDTYSGLQVVICISIKK